MMWQRMTNSPFFVVIKTQIEVEHAEIISSMKEIVSRNNRITHAEAG